MFHEDREKERTVFAKLAERYTGNKSMTYSRVFRLLGLRNGFCEPGLETVAYYYAASINRRKIDLALVDRVRRELLEAIIGVLEPVEGVEKVLSSLAGMGLALAVVSNASSQEAVEKLLEKHGLLRYFNAVITSRLVGVRKPDPRIFHYTLLLLGVRPSEAVFVGDRSYEDIYGAKSAGLYAVHLAVEEDPSPIADAVIKRITELPKVLEGFEKADR